MGNLACYRTSGKDTDPWKSLWDLGCAHRQADAPQHNPSSWLRSD